MLNYVEGNLIVTNEEKLKQKLNYSAKHFNKIPKNNIYVSQVVNKFKSKYSYRYIISKLKIFYWTNCKTEDEFLQLLKQKLNQDLDFIEFFT